MPTTTVTRISSSDTSWLLIQRRNPSAATAGAITTATRSPTSPPRPRSTSTTATAHLPTVRRIRHRVPQRVPSATTDNDGRSPRCQSRPRLTLEVAPRTSQPPEKTISQIVVPGGQKIRRRAANRNAFNRVQRILPSAKTIKNCRTPPQAPYPEGGKGPIK